MKVALNIPDCHIPWHDQLAYDLMIEVAKDVDADMGIDEINIMGDFADFYWANLHPILPGCMSLTETLKDEIYQTIQKLEELRRLFPDAKINFIEGNHEWRLVRYIVKKCPELYDLFTLPDILKFKDYDINYVPYGPGQLHSCLGTNYYLRHQPYSGAKNCASVTLQKKFISLGFGHTHRKQEYTATDALGKKLRCRSMGWLGDKSAPVFSYMDCPDWTQSFEFCYAMDQDTYWTEDVDIETKDEKKYAYYKSTLYISD